MRKIALLIIILLASFLRLYNLGSNPPSIYWDEASIGYNAYSILLTGADEYGTKLPSSFRSFDDYKPPLYIYLTVPSIAVFGLNEFAIRFPSAIFGILTVLITYFLVKEIFKNKNISITFKGVELDVPLLAALFIAISPWHLQFSRPAFEANVGLFFILSGILFFFKGLTIGRYFFLSAIFFALSLYTYHSMRVVTPLIVFSLSILFYNKDIWKKKFLLFFYIFLILSVLPVFMSLISSTGAGSRLSQVTIFNVPNLLDRSIMYIQTDLERGDMFSSLFHNRRLVYIFETIKGYLDHFNPSSLFILGDLSRHHHAADMGTLYLFELPMFLIGIFQLLKKWDKRVLFLLLVLLIAPLPSAITTGTPHTVRAIVMLFPLHVLSAYGLLYFIRFILELRSSLIKASLLIFSILFIFLNIYYYFHQYHVHTPIEYGNFWQYGYKELYQKAKKYESSYKNIIVTFENDHPDTYYLLYNKYDPFKYQALQQTSQVKINRFESKIGKYHFKKIDWDKDSKINDTLIIVSPSDIPKDIDEKQIDEVKFLSGKTAYIFLETKNEYSEN